MLSKDPFQGFIQDLKKKGGGGGTIGCLILMFRYTYLQQLSLCCFKITLLLIGGGGGGRGVRKGGKSPYESLRSAVQIIEGVWSGCMTCGV